MAPACWKVWLGKETPPQTAKDQSVGGGGGRLEKLMAGVLCPGGQGRNLWVDVPAEPEG